MLRRLIHLFVLLGLAGIIASIHLAATANYLYWLYPWLDTLVHFLGGMLIGFVFLVLWNQYRELPLSITKLLLLVFVVGVGWEVFEFAIGVPMEARYIPDTIIDLWMDLNGGIVAYILTAVTEKPRPS